MNQLELEYRTKPTGASQAAKILAVLETNRGQWVEMPDLAAASGAYAVHSRISQLRQEGHGIDHENRWEKRDGRMVCKSFYRLSE